MVFCEKAEEKALPAALLQLFEFTKSNRPAVISAVHGGRM